MPSYCRLLGWILRPEHVAPCNQRLQAPRILFVSRPVQLKVVFGWLLFSHLPPVVEFWEVRLVE